MALALAGSFLPKPKNCKNVLGSSSCIYVGNLDACNDEPASTTLEIDIATSLGGGLYTYTLFSNGSPYFLEDGTFLNFINPVGRVQVIGDVTVSGFVDVLVNVLSGSPTVGSTATIWNMQTIEAATDIAVNLEAQSADSKVLKDNIQGSTAITRTDLLIPLTYLASPKDTVQQTVMLPAARSNKPIFVVVYKSSGLVAWGQAEVMGLTESGAMDELVTYTTTLKLKAPFAITYNSNDPLVNDFSRVECLNVLYERIGLPLLDVIPPFNVFDGLRSYYPLERLLPLKDYILGYGLATDISFDRPLGVNNNQRYFLDGSKYMQSSSPLRLTNTSFTLSFWFRARQPGIAPSGSAYILSDMTYDSDNSGSLCVRLNDGALELIVVSTVGSVTVVTPLVSASPYNPYDMAENSHVVVTYSIPDKTVIMYLNGSEYLSYVFPNPIEELNFSNNTWTIGNSSFTLGMPDMLNDEVGLWDRALPSLEVNALYAGGLGLFPPIIVDLTEPYPLIRLRNYYKFESATTFNQDSVGLNPLVNVGTGSAFTPAGFNGGGLMSANGISGSMSTFAFFPNQTSFSVSFWMKAPSTSMTGALFGNKNFPSDSSNAIMLRLVNNVLTLSLSENLGGTGTTSDPFNTVINDNNWHNIIFTYDQSNTNHFVYIDGVLSIIYSTTEGDSLITSSNSFYLNKAPMTNGLATATYDELGIWDIALNQAEVDIIYNAGLGNFPPI
jgi:hypothetical protein